MKEHEHATKDKTETKPARDEVAKNAYALYEKEGHPQGHDKQNWLAVEAQMNLKVLLPFQVFAEKTGVLRIVAETREGEFGLLPHRLDCVAALAPGILTYETESDGEVFVAVDEGVLVKTGADVLISVRRALSGTDLGQLQEAVEKEFLTLDQNEQIVRTVMAKLETGFLRRFATFQHE